MQHDVSLGMAAAALPLQPLSLSFFFFFTEVGAFKNIKVAMFARFMLNTERATVTMYVCAF